MRLPIWAPQMKLKQPLLPVLTSLRTRYGLGGGGGGGLEACEIHVCALSGRKCVVMSVVIILHVWLRVTVPQAG